MKSATASILLLASLAFPAIAAQPKATEHRLEGDAFLGFKSTESASVAPSVNRKPPTESQYVHETPEGLVSYTIRGKIETVETAKKSGNFTIASTYGETRVIPANGWTPFGWGTIQGYPNTSRTIINLNGAPYGAQHYLNSYLTIPPNWVRIQGSAGYGRYLNVDGAPFAAQIHADSTFTIPRNWVRVSGASSGYGNFVNTTGAPSGTQWVVDSLWGIPAGWTFVNCAWGGYCWARKL